MNCDTSEKILKMRTHLEPWIFHFALDIQKREKGIKHEIKDYESPDKIQPPPPPLDPPIPRRVLNQTILISLIFLQ